MVSRLKAWKKSTAVMGTRGAAGDGMRHHGAMRPMMGSGGPPGAREGSRRAGGGGRDAAPASDEADDAFGGDAASPVGVEAGVAVAFGETPSVGAFDEGEVGVSRLGGELEGAVDQELACGGIEEVVAADDLAD